MSGMDKFSSKVHRVHMELGGELLNSLRIKTQFFERLQSVGVVDGAAHTQKDDVKSNRGSLEKVASTSSQYLISTRWMSRRGLLRSLGRCCLGLVALLVAGGAAEVLPVSLNCPLPLRRTHPPTLVLFRLHREIWALSLLPRRTKQLRETGNGRKLKTKI